MRGSQDTQTNREERKPPRLFDGWNDGSILFSKLVDTKCDHKCCGLKNSKTVTHFLQNHRWVTHEYVLTTRLAHMKRLPDRDQTWVSVILGAIRGGFRVQFKYGEAVTLICKTHAVSEREADECLRRAVSCCWLTYCDNRFNHQKFIFEPDEPFVWTATSTNEMQDECCMWLRRGSGRSLQAFKAVNDGLFSGGYFPSSLIATRSKRGVGRVFLRFSFSCPHLITFVRERRWKTITDVSNTLLEGGYCLEDGDGDLFFRAGADGLTYHTEIVPMSVHGTEFQTLSLADDSSVTRYGERVQGNATVVALAPSSPLDSTSIVDDQDDFLAILVEDDEDSAEFEDDDGGAEDDSYHPGELYEQDRIDDENEKGTPAMCDDDDDDNDDDGSSLFSESVADDEEADHNQSVSNSHTCFLSIGESDQVFAGGRLIALTDIARMERPFHAVSPPGTEEPVIKNAMFINDSTSVCRSGLATIARYTLMTRRSQRTHPGLALVASLALSSTFTPVQDITTSMGPTQTDQNVTIMKEYFDTLPLDVRFSVMSKLTRQRVFIERFRMTWEQQRLTKDRCSFYRRAMLDLWELRYPGPMVADVLQASEHTMLTSEIGDLIDSYFRVVYPSLLGMGDAVRADVLIAFGRAEPLERLLTVMKDMGRRYAAHGLTRVTRGPCLMPHWATGPNGECSTRPKSESKCLVHEDMSRRDFERFQHMLIIARNTAVKRLIGAVTMPSEEPW